MRLPFGEQAVVPEAKLVDYLFSDAHPIGRGKAAFFARLVSGAINPSTFAER